MDTGKLLKVINDLLAEEKKYKLQPSFQSLLSHYTQSTTDSINSERKKIREAAITSRVSKYPLSDYEVLEKLDAETYYGPGSIQRLEDILNMPAHEVQTELQEYVENRNTTVDALTRLKKSLEEFNFETRELDDNNYLIGFTLPTKYQDLEQTEKAIKDFRLFLEALSNAIGKQQPVRINYVSNGTIQFFIDAGLELAEHFDLVLDYALKIYAAIKASADIKKSFAGFKKKRKESAEKIAEEEKKEQVEALLNDLIKVLDIKNEDDKNRVKELFKSLLKHLENGVSAEVHTPQIEEPDEPAEDATKSEKEAYQKEKKLFEKKKEIDSRNQEIFILQQNNFYGMNTNFLNEINEDKSSDSK